MKQINLLPWREQEKKLNIRRFIVVWFCVSCASVILLCITSIVISQQIKNYQLMSHHTALKLKASLYKIKNIKRSQYEEKELKKIIKMIQINHFQLKKILEFIIYFKYLVSPEAFINLIEFYPPYFILILHASSEKNYLRMIKAIQNKLGYKLKILIFNRSKESSALDFLIKISV